MKNWKKFALKLHRYLSYLMFIQLFLWILGGVVFSVIPFNEITKSGNVLVKPTVILPTGWQKHLSTLGSEDITNITTFVSAIGPAYRLQQASGNVLTMTIDGQSFPQVTEEQVSQFAKTLHQGEGKIQRIKRLDSTEYRLGIVDEMYGKKGVWQVQFDDDYGTRLYFDGRTGEYLSARNNFWALYDFFWRLHIMDYRDGESFNGILLRISAIVALFFTLSGMLLTFLAIKRNIKGVLRR
ncbi:hypothetical protein [Serratia sp. DD3]|uniref:hypothetical protein n=1 Tax=Serratia sp. DD3 TaxID=1410619 RepID=UPI0004D5985B|nr:hypothetical protein [Serratia sp. DD3]KEY56466.1 hypothetical protein SRDD_45110 [Serratia sp. DD3]KEY56686.1 hypothetical protein SRDD_42750 [Serratia sp. DD3]KEY58380.1 hypothetical protein SRDD_26260 [Serratia sp. DD3]KEY59397.1 hypothetical protein SRDD_16800 [Serratia sp. DD3]